MNFLDDFIFYGSLISDNRTLKLLRADNAPLIMAFLKNIFQEESEVDYIEARERLTEFLSELQKQYPDENRSSATVYFREWIANGWIREVDIREYRVKSIQPTHFSHVRARIFPFLIAFQIRRLIAELYELARFGLDWHVVPAPNILRAF